MISLVDWQAVCARKDQGGLGLLNLNTINIALLAKWWYRFSNPAVIGKWKTMLLFEYGKHGYHFRVYVFWSVVFKVKFVVEPGCSKHLRNGKNIFFFFWIDRWIHDCTLSSLFPNLYSVAVSSDITVDSSLQNGVLHLSF